MKNRKGFTLVELLAIIVILAVIMVIAVPQILNVVNGSTNGASWIPDSLFSSQTQILKLFKNSSCCSYSKNEDWNVARNLCTDEGCQCG